MQQSAKPSAIHNEWCLWLCASIKQLCNQNRHTGDGGDNLNFPVRLAYIDWFIAAILVYDATDRDNDNRLTQTDANLNTTAFEYDALNRRTRIQYADTNDVTFSYDENGNRTGMIDANGLSFTFIVDALNRETEKQYPAPATPAGDAIQTIVNQYDANNNITNITETYAGTTGTRTTTQQFDAFDRLTEKTDANSERIRYSFDANGNRKTVRDPDGSVTHYTYDALNRVSDIAGQQGITNYRYDRSSLKTRVTYPNSSEARHTYDNAGRVLTIENRQNNAVVSSYEYRYDTNGNRTQQIETNGGAAETTDYSFDANDRLSEVAYPDQTTAYTYDAAYNRLTETTTDNNSNAVTVNKTYAYNNRNQVTTVTDNLDAANTASYAYDDNGNRISKTQNAIVTAFNYDVRDQLREILSGGSSVGQFLYDYQGLRIRKQTATETLRYVYDDQSVLLQTDDSGNTISKYDYGPDRLLSLSHATEGAQFYLFDALGSVVNLTRTDGAIQARYQYDAWGNIRNQVGASANEFGFTGHEMDEESGLIYMKGRFYDPSCACFVTQDGFEGEVNLPPSLHKYLYAFANPLVFFDPDGNVTQPIDPNVDLEGARAQARENTRRQKESLAKLENAACGTPNAPPQCIVPDEKLREDVTETFEDSRGVGTESAVTDNCNDPACEIQRSREKVAGTVRKVGEVASKTGDVIEVVATPDETDIIAVTALGVLGVIANKVRKIKKALGAVDATEDAAKTRKLSNKELGIFREQRVQAKLESRFGKENVLREKLLLDKNGNKIIDPITEKGRRIDFIVLNNDGTAKFSVEVTSRNQVRTGGKIQQIQKENRIRREGGIFVRDPDSGRLIDVSKVRTRIVGVEPN